MARAGEENGQACVYTESRRETGIVASWKNLPSGWAFSVAERKLAGIPDLTHAERLAKRISRTASTPRNSASNWEEYHHWHR